MRGQDKMPSSNGLLLDFNSFISADLLLRPVHADPIWDNVHCFSNILESLILADELVLPLPLESRLEKLPILATLKKEGILRLLDVDSEPVSAVRKALPKSLPLDALPRLADWVLKNHRELTRFEHFFPVTACNTWMAFDSPSVYSSSDGYFRGVDTMLWGATGLNHMQRW